MADSCFVYKDLCFDFVINQTSGRKEHTYLPGLARLSGHASIHTSIHLPSHHHYTSTHLSVHCFASLPTPPSTHTTTHPHIPSPIHLLTYYPPICLLTSPPSHTSAYPSLPTHPHTCQCPPIHSPTRPFSNHPPVHHKLINAYSHPSKWPRTLPSTQLPTTHYLSSLTHSPMYVPIYPSTYGPTHTPLIYPSNGLQIWPPRHSPTHAFIHPFTCISTSLFIYDHLPTHPFIYPFIHSSAHPSHYQSDLY